MSMDIEKKIIKFIGTHKKKVWMSDMARKLDLPLREVAPVVSQLQKQGKLVEA